MTKATYNRVCQCCGTHFTARHPGALWCNVNCRVQAYYCRKRGEPVRPAYSNRYAADPALLVQRHGQPTHGHESRVWAGTPITRRQADGYVNATAMCQANGRLWADYQRLDRTQDYLSALRDHLSWTPEDSSAQISPCLDAPELVISIKGGTPELQGTWIHPLLAVDLARWISPRFAVWMDGWFLSDGPFGGAAARRLSPAATLPEGVHIVAPTKRRAAEIWWQTVRAELCSAVDQRSNPTHRTDYGLPLVASYTWHSAA